MCACVCVWTVASTVTSQLLRLLLPTTANVNTASTTSLTSSMSSFFVYIFWSFYAFIGQRHLRYNRKLQEREPRNDMQQRHYCQHCQNQLHSAAIDIVLPLLYLLPVLLPLLSLPDHYTTTVNLSFSLCLSCIIITSSNYIQSQS